MDFAWVIEHGTAPFYWTGNGFSPANGDAVRFARKVDAERALCALKTDDVRAECRVIEHGWHTDPSPARRCEACNLPVDEGRFLCDLCKVGFDKTVWAALCRGKHDLLIEPLRVVARSHGYALAVHGSLARDIDVVAVPWTAEAVEAEALVAALAAEVERVNGHVYFRDRDKNPTEKPHGRRAWAIHLGGGPYIDLSVMPLQGEVIRFDRDEVAYRFGASSHSATSGEGEKREAEPARLHRQETVPYSPGRPDAPGSAAGAVSGERPMDEQPWNAGKHPLLHTPTPGCPETPGGSR